MSEKRFTLDELYCYVIQDNKKRLTDKQVVDLLNEQQEFIEELQVSDEMGWKRAEKFEKKCPKELHNKKMYIKRLEYKVQKFKEENEQLQQILKDIVAITDETYTKEDSIYKVTLVFDNEKYREIRKCLNE